MHAQISYKDVQTAYMVLESCMYYVWFQNSTWRGPVHIGLQHGESETLTLHHCKQVRS